MKVRNYGLLLILLLSVSSCKTIGPPENTASSGLYGYIEFEEGLYFDNKSLNILFYPIENDDTEIEIPKSENIIAKTKIVMKSTMGKRFDDNTFWIANIEPGFYGLILLEDELQTFDLWSNPINNIVEVKEGQINYWGAVYSTVDRNDSESFYSEPHMDISRSDILGKLEPRLSEIGWMDWILLEKQRI